MAEINVETVSVSATSEVSELSTDKRRFPSTRQTYSFLFGDDVGSTTAGERTEEPDGSHVLTYADFLAESDATSRGAWSMLTRSLRGDNMEEWATHQENETEDEEGNNLRKWACLICYEQCGEGTEVSRYEWAGISMGCGCDVCSTCFESWCKVKLEERTINIYCPIQGCGVKVPEDLLLAILDREHWAKYQQIKIEVSHNPDVKTCPDCGAVTFRGPTKETECVKCKSMWCFDCHSPTHTGMTCSEFQGRDRKFLKWNKKHASRCPVCQAPIQKTEGCNHMNCRVCNTHFCYACCTVFNNGEVDPALHKCPKLRWGRRRRAVATATVAVGVVTVGLAVGLPLCLAGGVIVGTGWGIYYSVAKPVELIRRLHRRRMEQTVGGTPKE